MRPAGRRRSATLREGDGEDEAGLYDVWGDGVGVMTFADSRTWTFGMKPSSFDSTSWEYFVAWGTPCRDPLIYLTFLTWKEAQQVGNAMLDAARRMET